MHISRLTKSLIIALTLLLIFSATVIGLPLAQDIIVAGGPRGDIQTLYRSFDGGAWEAQVVSLAPFDDVTGAALTIDTPHHEVHEGEMQHAEYTNGNVSNAASVDLRITTGAKDPHIVFEVFASGQTTVYLYGAPTLFAGTVVTTYDMNRTLFVTPTVTIRHSPTVTNTNAVALVNGRILPGGNSPQTRVGGGVRQGIEWILAPNTEYLLRATNTSGSSAAINTVLEWYEE